MQALLYVLLAVIVIGGPAGGVYVHMRAKMSAAEETLNATWRATLAEAEKEYVEMASAAIRAAMEVDVVSADSYQLDELCQQNTSCRDRGGAKR